MEYKKCQDLFARNRSKLAADILDVQPLLSSSVLPDIKQVEVFYRKIFEKASIVDEASVEPVGDCSNEYTPIAPDEVVEATKGWRNSAPGPDGITVAQVNRCDTNALTALFNIVLMWRETPSRWRV